MKCFCNEGHYSKTGKLNEERHGMGMKKPELIIDIIVLL
jgi:hypothetical protein